MVFDGLCEISRDLKKFKGTFGTFSNIEVILRDFKGF